MRYFGLSVLALFWLLAGAPAHAASASTQGTVNLRAGPGAVYPRVLTIPPVTLLTVDGCLDDFSWCDVAWEGNRGWVYGRLLYLDFEQRRVPVTEYGPRLGLAVVTFTIGDYWHRYYRQQPWYRREREWAARLPPRASPRRGAPPPPSQLERPPPRREARPPMRARQPRQPPPLPSPADPRPPG